MNEEQQRFLELLASRIPRLFGAISQGNVKSEYIIGTRRIGQKEVRLKLVAEVVDPGANPLATHGMLLHQSVESAQQAIQRSAQLPDAQVLEGQEPGPASRRRRPRKR